MPNDGPTVTLDLNDSGFQADLFSLEKDERHQAMETLKKFSRLRWDQIYADKGLRWEKIASIKPPEDVPTVYSLRINRARRATAYRKGNSMCFLSIAPDHDATYGKK